MSNTDHPQEDKEPLTVATVHAILGRFITDHSEGDSPAFVEVDGKEVPLRLVSQRMGGKHVKFCG